MKKDNPFKVDLTNAPKDKIFYSLAMFPYPSGAGLHVGHAMNFTANDIIARFKRMNGFTVLNPIGWDSFGLPTEGYAMKVGKPADVVTEENVASFIEQCRLMDWSYDRDRELATSSPSYYKRTQRIFQELYKAGLVYRKEAFVNRCPQDQTVLANDQVVNGACERCGTEVVQKKHMQWFIKITDYAERLINDLDGLDWPDETKTQQKYWIGKSEGAEIDFSIENNDTKITVFTTRPDTIYGVTAIVLAPENETIDALLTADNKEKLTEYRKATGKKTNLERQQDAEDKSGIFSGVYATHPLTNEQVPVWFADYVLPDYATGAVMFVPAHDERDRAFAKKHNLNAKQVIAPYYPAANADFALKVDKEITRRTIVTIIVKHPTEDKYVVLKHRNMNDSIGFPTGGIEEGEDMVSSAIREAQEELGYKNYSFVTALDNREVHSSFYAPHKDVNRYITQCGVVLQLDDLQVGEAKNESHDDFEIIWADKAEVSKLQTRGNHLALWDFYTNPNAFTGAGVLINSGEFDGTENTEAKKKIIDHIEAKGFGRRKITYKLRDRSISRQRYWGCPIPFYYTFAENEQVPYFEYTDEVWGYRADEPVVARQIVQAVVKNTVTGKYAVLDWKVDHSMTFIGGGVEEGESPEQAVIREIKEEAGITDLKLIQQIGPEVHRKFYHALKKKNYYTTNYYYLFETTQDISSHLAEEENQKHDALRMTVEDILTHKTDPDTEYIFDILAGKEPKVQYVDRYNAFNPHPDKAQWIPNIIPQDELPVKLPLDLGNYKPAGKSPLADHPTFPHYTAKDGKTYLRECDTLDTFMDSAFYFLRFIDPQNENELVSKELADKCMPVDFYMGGKEHTYGHLLYSRFINKFLCDRGYISNSEPFQKLFHQGFVLGPDGRKMSKRWGNVINPSEVANEFGSDTTRTYTMFMGPIEQEKVWNSNTLSGVKKFIERVERLEQFISDEHNVLLEATLHKTIKGVTEDIERIKFNTAVSKMMVFVNDVYDKKVITKSQLSTFVQLLAPFATKLSQEMRTKLGNEGNIHFSQWPTFDAAKIAEDTINLPIQMNGKMKGTLEVSVGLSQDEIMDKIKADEKFASQLDGNEIAKIIFVQDKIVNIIIK